MLAGRQVSRHAAVTPGGEQRAAQVLYGMPLQATRRVVFTVPVAGARATASGAACPYYRRFARRGRRRLFFMFAERLILPPIFLGSSFAIFRYCFPLPFSTEIFFRFLSSIFFAFSLFLHIFMPSSIEPCFRLHFSLHFRYFPPLYFCFIFSFFACIAPLSFFITFFDIFSR